MTTTADMIWAQRRTKRHDNGKDFLRKLLGGSNEDGEGDVRQDWLKVVYLEEMDDAEEKDDKDVHPSGRR